ARERDGCLGDSLGRLFNRIGADDLRSRRERARGGLELAFRVDQEIGGTDDLLPGRESLEHDELIASVRSQFDLGGSEITVTAIDKGDIVRARAQNRS